jgi:uncharacterized protein (TIGR02145 family)
MPTVEYEGQVYNTIQIFSQCWLKENLNVGIQILSGGVMTDNGIINKYCYNNESDSCTKYGGLYQAWEMMQYTQEEEGVQGICPPGWHIPTEEEWKVLAGAVDSQYGIGDPEWYWFSDIEQGYNAGMNLKTTSGWYENGNGTDLFGFSGLPGGGLDYFEGYYDVNYSGYWWTTTGCGEMGWYDTRVNYLSYGSPKIHVLGGNGSSRSVRCLRDQ